MDNISSPPGGLDTSSDGSLPARIGNYRVLRRLATGGTSDVLLARAEGPRASEGTVVLKLMLQEYREDPSFEKMFASEAAAYSRLSHPAIVKLYDFFGDGDQPVMVLEYVDGMPLHRLRALLKRGKFLDDAAAMFVAWRVFGALGAAHTAKDPRTGQPAPVIHRDVNPSNVLIPWDGQVKIADFGIAKVAGMDNDKTQAGFIKGTYGYMAPEQVRGVEVTDRADVYAASLLLWELLVGRKAIVRGGTSDLDVLRAMAEPAFPSLAALRPELPLEVLDAVGRGLEPDPAKRTITADELAGILRISCNLEDGRQRLVDALGGVRPAQRPDELAVTVSRPPRPAVDASADATIPNLAALADDSQTLPPMPPLAAVTSSPPPPAVAPLARKPTLPLTSRPSTAPRPSNAPLPNTSSGKSGPPGRVGAATLMGITPGTTPPPPAPGIGSAPPPAMPVQTPPPPPPAPVLTPVPPPTGRPVTQPLPTVVIAQTPPAIPVAKPLAVTMPLRTPSPPPPPPPPPTVRTPPPPPPPPGGSVPPSQMPTAPASFVISPLAATGPMAQTQGPPPVQGQAATPAPMPAAWTPPPPAPASPPPAAMPTYPDAAHAAHAASTARRSARIVAGIAALVTLVVGVLVIAWERGRTPSAYVPPAPGSPAASVVASSAPAAPSAVPSPAAAPSPAMAAATPAPSSRPSATPSAVALSSLAPGMGTITVTPAQSGHRVWVDTHVVGESPGTFTVRCGWRSVMVGSDGWRHNVNIPCGGDIVIH